MRLILAALPLLLPCAALAQDYGTSLRVIPYSAPGLNTPTAPLFTQANPGYVTGGTGGSGSGGTASTVTQGTPGSTSAPWYVDDQKLEALIVGSGLNVNVAFPTSQAVTGAFYQATQPVSGTFFQTTQPVSIAGTQSVADTNSAAFGGVVVMTPGTATTALRSVGFVITTAGNVTFTFADTSTITLAEPASPAFTTLPFSVTTVTLGTGTAGTFWELK